MKNQPISAIILIIAAFLISSCSNAQQPNTKAVAAISPTKMNVIYLGVNNPIKVAVSGYNSSDLEVSIPDNGVIEGSNGSYIVRPKRPGNLFIVVKHNDEIIQKTEFRVKTVPDPIAAAPKKSSNPNNYYTSGPILKDELIKAGKLVCIMRNFDFDLSFNVVSFVITANDNGSTKNKSEMSDGNKYSKQQIELMKSLKKGQKVIFEDIEAKGPDGKTRHLSPLVFTIE